MVINAFVLLLAITSLRQAPQLLLPTVNGLAAQVTATTDTKQGAEGTTVYKVGNDVSAPVPVFKPEPPYTKEARRAKLEGTAKMEVLIDDHGDVANVKEISPPLGKGLDESAVKTVLTWKFRPAMHKGS